MSITRQDILDLTNAHEQLDMFAYWAPDAEEQQHKDHVGKTPLEMVIEYHKATDSALNQDFKMGSDLECFRFSLISEEYDEFESESKKENILKELADLVYVIYGYAATFGWDLDEAVRRVHENNMGRMYQPDGTIKRREDGKIIKNKDYTKVNLEGLV